MVTCLTEIKNTSNIYIRSCEIDNNTSHSFPRLCNTVYPCGVLTRIAVYFRAGDNVTVDIPLKNHGNIKKKYSLEATDDKSFVERQDPVQVEIDQEETISFPVRLIAPKTTPTGTVSTLTVTGNFIRHSASLQINYIND